MARRDVLAFVDVFAPDHGVEMVGEILLRNLLRKIHTNHNPRFALKLFHQLPVEIRRAAIDNANSLFEQHFFAFEPMSITDFSRLMNICEASDVAVTLESFNSSKWFQFPFLAELYKLVQERLWIAIESNDESFVEAAILFGIDYTRLNIREDGWSPLYLACATGSADAVRVLLDDADSPQDLIHEPLLPRINALHVLGMYTMDSTSSVRIAKMILDISDDPAALLTEVALSKGQNTPIHAAILENSIDLIKLYGTTLERIGHPISDNLVSSIKSSAEIEGKTEYVDVFLKNIVTEPHSDLI